MWRVAWESRVATQQEWLEGEEKENVLKARRHTGVETQDDNHIWVHIAPLIY